MAVVLNDLFDYGLKIYQKDNGFKFSLDSILLAEFVKISNRTSKILDLCTGNAAVPLILSTKTKANIKCVEIQKEIYEIAKKSIDYNKLCEQIEIYNDNIKDIDKYFKNDYFDIVTCNPPYFKVDECSNLKNNQIENIARHEIYINLDEIFSIAASRLSSGGEFYLVHRANRLDEIIIYGNKHKLNVKNLELIKTKPNGNPYIVLIRCVKNSKFGVKINDIKCINNLKTYKNLFREE